MVSFSSSAVNKSGKKFAPKAPVRRARPAPNLASPAPQEGPAIVQQNAAAQPTQRPTGSAAISPEPPAPVDESFASSAAPKGPQTRAAEPDSRKKGSTQLKGATAISIPRPKPKTYASVTVPKPNYLVPAPRQPTPPSQTAATTEREPEQRHSLRAQTEPDRGTGGHTHVEASPEIGSRGNSITSADFAPSYHPPGDATEIRPRKRLKTTNESPVALQTAQSTALQTIPPPATQTQVSAVDEAIETLEEGTSHVTTDEGRKAVKPKSRRRASTSGPKATRGTRRARRPRARKQREPTPEGAENAEIAPTVVKMSDLCKDLRTGKISKRETELRNMELAEAERKQKTEQKGGDQEQTPIKQNGDAPTPAAELTDTQEAKGQSGPVMRIVNGEIVLDTASLQVDRHADADRNAGELEDVIENPLTRRINQSSYGKRAKGESWDEEATDLFYRGLRMFGTDFMMISKLFPSRTRHQIKLKFNNEERRRPEKIKRTLLGPGETIDIETYSEMTNSVYDDPKVIQQELDEDKKRIEDQHAKEKEAQEEMLRNPGGADAGPSNAYTVADVPVKGKRNNKRQLPKSMGGGTEEVVGSIDDLP